MLLGLTLCQAKVFISLTKLGEASTEEIAKASNIARPNVYQTFEALQKAGLVEKKITKPIKFRPIEMKRAIQILLANKTQQYEKAKKHSAALEKKYEKNENRQYSLSDNEDFILIPKKTNNKQRMYASYRKALSNISHISSLETIKNWGSADLKVIEETSKRGVKMRFLINDPPEMTKAKFLTKIPLEIRITPTRLPMNFVLFDRNELHINILDVKNINLSPHLWTNNSCIILLAEGYFEQVWEKSKDFI
jgi:sugar-specific transcriptional regulator TrmB